MSWNEIGTQESKKVEFLKFPTGITNMRVLDREPHSRWQHWMPNAKRSVTCIGKGCPICELIATAKANGVEPVYTSRKTHSLNVINRTTGKVEVLEQGNNFFEDLRILHTDDGDVTTYDIKVRRTGSGTNTKYRLDALEAAPLSAEDEALVADKIDLADYFSAPTKEQLIQLINGVDPKEVFTSKSEDVELA